MLDCGSGPAHFLPPVLRPHHDAKGDGARRKARQAGAGSADRAFFGCGFLANETSVGPVLFYFNRLDRKTRKQVIAHTDSCHGSTCLAMSMTGAEFDHHGFGVAPDFNPCPDLYRGSEGKSIESHCDDKVADFGNVIPGFEPEIVAAFIAEPTMGTGRAIVPPPGNHRRTMELDEKCDNANGPVQSPKSEASPSKLSGKF